MQLRKRFLALSTALAVGLIPTALIVSTANAATTTGISSVKLLDATPKVGIDVQVEATWDAATGAVEGDQFSLDIPAPFKASDIAPIDLGTADGGSAGTCVANGTKLTCTLSAYVNGKTNVHGTLWFKVKSTETMSPGNLDWTTDTSIKYTTELANGIIGTSSSVESSKSGWTNTANPLTMNYQIKVGPADYVPGTPLVIVDTAGGGQIFDNTSYRYVTQSATNYSDSGTFTNIPGASVVVNGNTATITIPNPLPNQVMLIKYRAKLPAGTKNNDLFTNSARLSADKTVSTTARYTASGGTGTGDPTETPTTPTETPTTPTETPTTPTETTPTETPTTPTETTPTETPIESTPTENPTESTPTETPTESTTNSSESSVQSSSEFGKSDESSRQNGVDEKSKRAGTQEELPNTGANVAVLVGGGMLLTLFGAIAFYYSRRPRYSRNH